jgi:hypothetical protein
LKSIPSNLCTRACCRLAAALARVIFVALCGAGPAQAHAFGPRYDLPLPLDLYLAGAGAAVALSFVIMALAFRSRPAERDRPRVDLRQFAAMRALLDPLATGAIRVVSLGIFVLVLAAGLFGNEDTARNFAPTFVWIVWWVGLAYVAALLGNIWPALNPWSIAYAGLEGLARLCGARPRRTFGLNYPAWLGVWPAVLLFGLFAWLELIAESGTAPRTLATAILIYSALTWAAMAAFGREVWLERGEAFSLAFAVFGRFAPIGQPERGPDGSPGPWPLRPYAGDLVVDRPCSLSMTVFVILMLSTVTFDGFKETPLWGRLLQGIAFEPWLHPAIRQLHDLGFDFQAALETVMLALFPLAFLLVYLGFSWLTRQAAGSRRPVAEVAGLFVLSLVPIAIAYHLAHYLSYLLIAGQFIIPLISDPFGFGWNLFGTADYAVDITVIGPKFVWYTAVIAIVVGHVFAVGVAHLVALGVFDTARAALRSQVPFLALMVAYTMASLWILSQPIVGGPSLSTLRAPSATLTLAPFEFREICYKLSPQDEIGYGFEADRPIDFDIHYHDGLTIHVPVSHPGTSARAGKFVPEREQFYCLLWLNRSLETVSLTYRVSGP